MRSGTKSGLKTMVKTKSLVYKTFALVPITVDRHLELLSKEHDPQVRRERRTWAGDIGFKAMVYMPVYLVEQKDVELPEDTG